MCLPKIICDIDGVLTDYPKCFQTYAHWFKTTQLTASNEVIKDHYRKSGYKRNLPVMGKNVNALNQISNLGCLIYLMTSRPADKYPMIDTDTRYWLHNNSVSYANIFYTNNKAETLLANFDINNSWCIDDEYENALVISAFGFKTFILNTDKNRKYLNIHSSNLLNWIDSLEELYDLILSQ